MISSSAYPPWQADRLRSGPQSRGDPPRLLYHSMGHVHRPPSSYGACQRRPQKPALCRSGTLPPFGWGDFMSWSAATSAFPASPLSSNAIPTFCTAPIWLEPDATAWCDATAGNGMRLGSSSRFGRRSQQSRLRLHRYGTWKVSAGLSDRCAAAGLRERPFCSRPITQWDDEIMRAVQ